MIFVEESIRTSLKLREYISQQSQVNDRTSKTGFALRGTSRLASTRGSTSRVHPLQRMNLAKRRGLEKIEEGVSDLL